MQERAEVYLYDARVAELSRHQITEHQEQAWLVVSRHLGLDK